MLIQRRKFLVGLGSLLAAPAIVHAGNLMPIKVVEMDLEQVLRQRLNAAYALTLKNINDTLYGGLASNFSAPTFYGKGMPELLGIARRPNHQVSR